MLAKVKSCKIKGIDLVHDFFLILSFSRLAFTPFGFGVSDSCRRIKLLLPPEVLETGITELAIPWFCLINGLETGVYRYKYAEHRLGPPQNFHYHRKSCLWK